MRAIGWIIGALMACATATASAQTRAPTETERLEELGRLWIYFELFSAHVATSGVDWDAALVETIPAVRRARTEAQYVAALNAMLARSGDPSARVIRDEEESQAAPPATRIEAGVAIANCSTIAAAADVPAALTELAQTPRGVVLDCRAFNVPWERAEAFIAALARSRTAQTLPAGATMVRAYSGYPPEEDGFRGYSAALSLVQEASIAPGRGAPSAHPLAIVIDAGMAPYLPTLAALRTAGAARLVADGGVGNGRVWVDIGADRWALMSRGVYIYPNGASGFRADASAGEDAVGAALALLSAPPAPTASAITPLLQGRPPHAYAGDDEAPPVEMRLLALYRLWGTIEYFFPYHELTDRPWDDTLEEFIPLFRDANTRAAYETAVLRLVARMQDRHAGEVRGLRAILYAAAPDRPNLATRYVQGRLAITAVRDAEVSDRVFVGDEILAVDNVPISQLEARLTPLISHSTPQSLRGLLSWYVLAGPEDSQAELTLRGADGAVRTVRVARSTPRRPPAEESPIWRTLEGNVGYIDLGRLLAADADRALDELIEARALILDLRGYPKGTAWILAPRLARRSGPIVAARFRRPLYFGPSRVEERTWASFDQSVQAPAGGAKFERPVYVLIDERAISQAEHTGMILEAAADVTFVGSPTTGANGDITTFRLPGGLTVVFTGVDVRWPDGRQLQRVGLQPDVAVEPTLAGVRAGRDEVLEAALELAQRAPQARRTSPAPAP